MGRLPGVKRLPILVTLRLHFERERDCHCNALSAVNRKVIVEGTSSGPARLGPRPSFLAISFLIYRLFSLAGLVPVGGYLVIHLLTNATILNGPAAFQTQVDRIHSLGSILPLVEWVFIFIPLLFHAVIGWLII